MADWALRMVVILKLVSQNEHAINSAWHQATAIFITPFVLLAPLNGPLSNGLPKRSVLAGSALYCLAVVLFFSVLDGPWLLCLGLVAAGTAVYNTTRYALLPAAAEDTGWPLPRVNAWIEMGGAAAIVAGLMLAAVPGALMWVLLCALVCVLTAVVVRFPSDVQRPEAPGEAVAGFFRDCGRILRDRAARGSLIGLACFLAVVTAGSGVVVSHALEQNGNGFHHQLLQDLILVLVGVAVGSLLAGLQGHLRRGLGLVPIGSAGLLVALSWAASVREPGAACLMMGLMAGLVSVPLRSLYQAAVPADARGNAMAVSYTANYVLTTGLALILLVLVRLDLLPTLTAQLWFLAGLAGVGVLVAGWLLCRDLLEQLTEIVLLPVYRIHGYGPGLEHFPMRGPVIVIGNHSAWCDPLWVAKVMPRRLFPMMTSVFFDRPILHWLMTHVVHAIRVPAYVYRRDAPELKEAVAVLDRGECLLLFPEGMLRRKEEQYVRLFGQGIWRILRDRPETPVVVCWIEGGWGSYTSFWKGPPLAHKRPDWWRSIRIGVSEPQVFDAALLKDHRATRVHLMRACLEARRHLGLEVPASKESFEEEPEPV
jgi:1-acyl-sn-glycerol-3-phosphate acyltransferase